MRVCTTLAIVWVAAATLAASAVADNPVGYSVLDVDSYDHVASGPKGASKLYSIKSQAYTDSPPQLLVLEGSRSNMGYDYGYLLAGAIKESYNNLLDSMIGKKWFTPIVKGAMAVLCDWQWHSFLSKHVPADFLAEIQGVHDGAKAAGIHEAGAYVTRAIVLANFPGDLPHLLYVVEDEIKSVQGEGVAVPTGVIEALDILKTHATDMQAHWTTFQCSMFAIWGDRTVDGDLYSCRNLDWAANTGINKHKIAVVYKPDGGAHSHATFGFAALYGALSGMSSKGLSVHEANLEQKLITFRGFPWVLRLRYIMEQAASLSEAQAIWEATNNTVGFNHMVTSASDIGSGKAAMVFETREAYTAYFEDDDGREASAESPDKSGEETHIGAPMKHALWRTNHGYDPQIRKTFMDPQSPTCNSVFRYYLIHNTFQYYDQSNMRVGHLEAINATSIVGDKGKDFFHCNKENFPHASNILSVMTQPGAGFAWVAWEDGSGDSWGPAACQAYLKLDLNKFW